jgi:hypothetical protein
LLSCLVFSCVVLCCLVLFCLISSHLVLPSLVLSSLVLSRLFFCLFFCSFHCAFYLVTPFVLCPCVSENRTYIIDEIGDENYHRFLNIFPRVYSLFVCCLVLYFLVSSCLVVFCRVAVFWVVSCLVYLYQKPHKKQVVQHVILHRYSICRLWLRAARSRLAHLWHHYYILRHIMTFAKQYRAFLTLLTLTLTLTLTLALILTLIIYAFERCCHFKQRGGSKCGSSHMFVNRKVFSLWCFVLCLVFSSLLFSSLVLSCLILSCLVLSLSLVLSCLVLSYLLAFGLYVVASCVCLPIFLCLICGSSARLC